MAVGAFVLTIVFLPCCRSVLLGAFSCRRTAATTSIYRDGYRRGTRPPVNYAGIRGALPSASIPMCKTLC